MRPCSDGKARSLKSEGVMPGASLLAHVQIKLVKLIKIGRGGKGHRSYKGQLLVLEVAGWAWAN